MLRRRSQVKKEITKATLARTQQTAAKKKPAKKKAAKKPAKKKAKKKKVVKYPGGKRPKGVHKSKASKARRFSFRFSARCHGTGYHVFHQEARGGQGKVESPLLTT